MVSQTKINIDKSGANTAALEDLNKEYKEKDEEEIAIRQNKYLNNMVEQDHRFIKRITRPMLGFGSLKGAKNTLCGIEMMHMIRKGQLTEHENDFPFNGFFSLWGQM